MKTFFIKEKTLLFFLMITLSNLSFGLSCSGGGYLILSILLLFLFIIFLSLKLNLERKGNSVKVIKLFNVTIFCILLAMLYRVYDFYMNGYKAICIGDFGCCPSPYTIQEVYLAELAFFTYLTSVSYKKIKYAMWSQTIKYTFIMLYIISMFISIIGVLAIMNKI